MSCIHIISPQQYAKLYDLLKEDKQELLNTLRINKDSLVKSMRRYPIEFEMNFPTSKAYIRFVVSTEESIQFIISTLELMLY